jgi:hypothetical protein
LGQALSNEFAMDSASLERMRRMIVSRVERPVARSWWQCAAAWSPVLAPLGLVASIALAFLLARAPTIHWTAIPTEAESTAVVAMIRGSNSNPVIESLMPASTEQMLSATVGP